MLVVLGVGDGAQMSLFGDHALSDCGRCFAAFRVEGEGPFRPVDGVGVDGFEDGSGFVAVDRPSVGAAAFAESVQGFRGNIDAAHVQVTFSRFVAW